MSKKDDRDPNNEDYGDHGGYTGQAFPLFVVLAGRSLNCHWCQPGLQVSQI